jgi:hypothetical protein
MFVEGDACFFTMELVDGVSFVEYAKEADGSLQANDRLVAALRQLVDGVSAADTRGTRENSQVAISGRGGLCHDASMIERGSLFSSY